MFSFWVCIKTQRERDTDFAKSSVIWHLMLIFNGFNLIPCQFQESYAVVIPVYILLDIIQGHRERLGIFQKIIFK